MSIIPAKYIYTAGEEHGFIVRAINYPRFPQDQEHILAQVTALARKIAGACCQKSYCIVDDDVTTYHTVDVPALRERP